MVHLLECNVRNLSENGGNEDIKLQIDLLQVRGDGRYAATCTECKSHALCNFSSKFCFALLLNTENTHVL